MILRFLFHPCSARFISFLCPERRVFHVSDKPKIARTLDSRLPLDARVGKSTRIQVDGKIDCRQQGISGGFKHGRVLLRFGHGICSFRRARKSSCASRKCRQSRADRFLWKLSNECANAGMEQGREPPYRRCRGTTGRNDSIGNEEAYLLVEPERDIILY
jgi:hypothetical protein